MSLRSDVILDRRRLKRRLLLWKVFSITLIAFIAIQISTHFDLISPNERIARLRIDGVIVNDHNRNKILNSLIDDDSIKALLVTINSPGGTFTGGEALFKNLRHISEKKPVVSLLEETATSAAYMVAIGGDYIISRAGTLTGSIGVILQTANLTELMKKLGIKSEIIKSGKFKGQPNPAENFSEEARQTTAIVIDDLFNMFVDMIAKQRSLERATVLSLSDGRLYSGRMAKDLGLVDLIGEEKEALAWLEKTHKIAHTLPIFDIKPIDERGNWSKLIKGIVGKYFISYDTLRGGVLSLWNPT